MVMGAGLENTVKKSVPEGRLGEFESTETKEITIKAESAVKSGLIFSHKKLTKENSSTVIVKIISQVIDDHSKSLA